MVVEIMDRNFVYRLCDLIANENEIYLWLQSTNSPTRLY